MIEMVRAQNGSVVVKDDGRLLSSAVDPQAEAGEWIARRRSFLDKVKVIFVLGAGSGYHIAELQKCSAAQIVVLDSSEKVIAAVREIHQFAEIRVKFECVQRGKALRSLESVKSGVAVSFTVLQHAPSVAGDPEFYRECQNLLNGREWGGLHWQWQLKGFSALDSQPKIHSGELPLTIYDLDSTELVQNSEERERMLVKALRELVK